MTPESAGELRRLFDLVCDLPASARRERLAREGAPAELVAEVEALLDADASSRSHTSAPVLRMLASLPESELGEGDRVGAWRLGRRLGSGGMGVVHLAERDDGHFAQQVAIKLIRGVASAETLDRFARERQLLAHLQHPNIARLLDGGATPSGHPYLVMEYVDGVRIDASCRERGLDAAARVDLFRSACAGVQFAHQHLVVHCDLKPSNILVRADGAPVLLDFGIARALDRPDAAGSGIYYTEGYASPEQMRGDPPSVACDVYALGACLRSILDAAAGDGRRGHRARRLAWSRRGELDAIVLRATASDPADRYTSVQALADDLGRWRERRTVQAHRNSFPYAATCFVRRRWPAVATIAFACTLGAVFAWQLAIERDRAVEAEHDARAKATVARRVADFLVSVFDVPAKDRHGTILARDVLDHGAARIDDELDDVPTVKAKLLGSLASAYRYLGQPPRAIDLFTRAAALDLDPRVDEPLAAASALGDLAVIYANNNFPSASAIAAARRSLALRRRYAPDDKLALGDSWNSLGVVLDETGDHEAAESALLKGLALRRAASRKEPLEIAVSLNNLGQVARHLGKIDDAIAYYAESLAIKARVSGEHTPSYQLGLQGYADALARSPMRRDEALPLLERNVALCRELYGESSARLAVAQNELGSVLHDRGRFAEAAAHYREAMRIHAEVSGEHSADYAVPLNNLASAYEDSGDYAAAIPLFERSLAIRRERLADDDVPVLRAEHNLARVLTRAGHLSAAKPLIDAELDGLRAHFGEDDANVVKSSLLLADWLIRSGRDAEAEQTLAATERSRAKLTPLLRAYRLALYATIATKRGDAATAIDDRRDAWTLVRDAFGADHPIAVSFAIDYAVALRRAGRTAEADAIAASVRSVIEAAFVKDSPPRRALARYF